MHSWNDKATGGASTKPDRTYGGLRHLPAIEKLLDTENLRMLTDDTLYDLEAELHELIIDVRKCPDDIPTQSISSKQSLLQNLRTASIKLNLAWDQCDTKGRTRRYYQYLSACKEYLEKAYGQYIRVTSEDKDVPLQSYSMESGQNVGKAFSPITFLIEGKTCLRELKDAQKFLQQTYELFKTVDVLWPDQCNQAIAKLQIIHQYIQNTLELLNSSSELPPGFSPLSYGLMVRLYQLDEQVRILISFITSFRPLCQTKSKQVPKMKGEILCKFETFEQSYQDILQSWTLFLQQVSSSESPYSKRHGLVLIKTLQ